MITKQQFKNALNNHKTLSGLAGFLGFRSAASVYMYFKKFSIRNPYQQQFRIKKINRQELLRLVKKHTSTESLKKELGYATRHSVNILLKRFNIPQYGRKDRKDINIPKVVELVHRGFGVSYVEKQLNASIKTIRRRCSEQGIRLVFCKAEPVKKNTLKRLLKKHRNNCLKVAKEVGRSKSSVYEWCRKYGLKVNTRAEAHTKITTHFLLEALLVDYGSAHAVAKRLGLNPTTVLAFLKRESISNTNHTTTPQPKIIKTTLKKIFALNG